MPEDVNELNGTDLGPLGVDLDGEQDGFIIFLSCVN